jgi:hypothetical protein
MSFYADRAVVMQPVWVVDRNGSNGYTDPLITADAALMATFPAAAQRPSTFYLPISYEDGSPIADITPIYRGNNGSFYTKFLNEFGFELEETLGSSWPDAVDDTVELLRSPQRTRPERLRRGRNIFSHSERELGYGWRLRHDNRFIDVPVTITSTNQIHTVTFDARAGAHITDWRVQIPGAGIDNQISNLALGYGRGYQSAFYIDEEIGQPGQLRSNPTQGGDTFSIDAIWEPDITSNEDWEYQASPVLRLSSVTNPDGSVTVDTVCLPLFFNPQDHPLGGLHKPMAFPESKLRILWTFNWQGREGVHRADLYYFTPFEIPYAPIVPAPGPQLIQLVGGWFIRDTMVDQLWIYDAANNTEHHAVQGVQMNSYAGTEDWVGSTLSLAAWVGPFGIISPPAAHPMPSGVGGIVWRDSGTHWGLGQDFAIASYARLSTVENCAKPVGWGWNANYTTTLGEAQGKQGNTGVQLFPGGQSNGGHPRGWIGPMTSYLITDTYANVKTKMRQLYLDGV